LADGGRSGNQGDKGKTVMGAARRRALQITQLKEQSAVQERHDLHAACFHEAAHVVFELELNHL
jgi:hypothetical protein